MLIFTPIEKCCFKHCTENTLLVQFCLLHYKQWFKNSTKIKIFNEFLYQKFDFLLSGNTKKALYGVKKLNLKTKVHNFFNLVGPLGAGVTNNEITNLKLTTYPMNKLVSFLPLEENGNVFPRWLQDFLTLKYESLRKEETFKVRELRWIHCNCQTL